jgi:hypothetical protein
MLADKSQLDAMNDWGHASVNIGAPLLYVYL